MARHHLFKLRWAKVEFMLYVKLFDLLFHFFYIIFMFSDTHFHFKMLSEEYGLDGTEILSTMANRDCFFGLDIGTKADDLKSRRQAVEKCGIFPFVKYSAGIWPDIDAIHDRERKIELLKSSIVDDSLSHPENKIVALGEFGLDHHWNPAGADGRKEDDFDEKTYRGERDLFEAQLNLAQNLNLPAIIHSRDAFEDTLDCIKNVGYNSGIIHCYSYGLEQARAFLDLGWYISFSGSVTYTKKAKFEEITKLLAYVPDDRILCETDSPYLAPVPHRGKPNSPVFVEYVYDFVAKARNISSEKLSDIVDCNIKNLFL